MKRVVRRLAAMALVFVLAFVVLDGPWILILPITLIFGWIPSAVRLAKAWYPDPGGVMLFVLGILVVITGSHAFLRWLHAATRNNVISGGTTNAVWRWKWTICGVAIIACSLLAIASLVLCFHQTYWFSRSTDPLFVQRYGKRGMYVLTDLLRRAEEVQWDVTKTRDAFMCFSFPRPGQLAVESFQPVWINKDEHALRAIVLVPRRPLHRESAWVAILEPGTNLVTRNLDELPQVLASLGIHSSSQETETAKPVAP